VAKQVDDPFAKALHDLCVAAGASCGARCDQGVPQANTAARRRSRRRNLTVAEAERLARG
jgi:hypothetical protein